MSDGDTVAAGAENDLGAGLQVGAATVRVPDATPSTSSPDAKPKQKRTRSVRAFPANPFEDVYDFATQINRLDPDGRVKRLTLFKALGRSPESGPSRELVTSANRYGVVEGGYSAEELILTASGKDLFSPSASKAKAAEFALAISSVSVFRGLYEQYKGKRLADRSVLADAAVDKSVPRESASECIDLFIINAKYIGLIDTIAGAETLLPIDHILDRAPAATGDARHQGPSVEPGSGELSGIRDWDRVCFYITAIGEEASEQRRHSDLFMGQVVAPALEELGLEVIRADHIGEAGMITAQVLEHVVKARLVVADLSWHNPNAYYELAIRHACRKPFVQICRKADRIPFDVGQARTIVIDTTDLYSFVPQLQSYRADIASHARAALQNSEPVQNPLTVFLPNFDFVIRR